MDFWEDNFNNLDSDLEPAPSVRPKEDIPAYTPFSGSNATIQSPKSTRAASKKSSRVRAIDRRDGVVRSLTMHEMHRQKIPAGMEGLKASLEQRLKSGSGDASKQKDEGTGGSAEIKESELEVDRAIVKNLEDYKVEDFKPRSRRRRGNKMSAADFDLYHHGPRRSLAARLPHNSATAAMKASMEEVVQKLQEDMNTHVAPKEAGVGETPAPASAAPVIMLYNTPEVGKVVTRQEAFAAYSKRHTTSNEEVDKRAASVLFGKQEVQDERANGDLKADHAKPESLGDSVTPSAPKDSPAVQKGVLQSAARPTQSAWLVEQLLIPKSETPGPRKSQQDTPAAQANAEPSPFGAQTSASRAAEVRAPGSVILTVASPSFGGQTPISKPSESLAKLHITGGWNLSDSARDSAAFAASTKTKAEKKPAAPRTRTTKDKQPDPPKKVPGRKRAKREIRSQPATITSKDATSSKGRNSSDKVSASVAKKQAEQEEAKNSAPKVPPVHAVVEPKDLAITPLDIAQPPVPALSYGLDRVLFNPGVYQLQDPHSRVYNFDPYLQTIMPVAEFDFNALKEYKTSSQDAALAALAKEHGKRYIGSTSSMTGTLGHFHYLLSAFRPLNTEMLSRGFPDKLETFTLINRAPNAIFLRWKNGTYAIDADKEYDSANVLMMLGKSMEKLLTMSTSEYERYRKTDPRSVSAEERTSPEAFQYTTTGDFLMRSQLDAYDPRLPGTGMFDLKTRAVVTVRMNTGDFEPMTGYQIHTLQGRFESYEREYYDMIRSTMLKYMLQVRMGRMDGIFVAYHNVERIFGFQYISLQDMDRALHGQVDVCLGDQEFKVSLDMLNKVFDMATAKFPEQSLRFHFEAVQETLKDGDETTVLWTFAEPMAEDQIDEIQSSSKARIAEFEREMMGIDKDEKAAEDAAVANEGGRDTAAGTIVAASTSSVPEPAAKPNKPTKPAATTDSKGTDTLAPLFVASVICQSEVNGNVVARPETLRPSDTWKVEHVIQEYPAEANMWARYEQTKARRRDLFAKFISDGEEDADAPPKAKEEVRKMRKNESYIAMMKSMSKKGREFRDRADEMEAGSEKVVVGHPLKGEGVEGVDDYLGWLYGKR